MRQRPEYTKERGERLGSLEEVCGGNGVAIARIDRDVDKRLLQSVKPGTSGGIRKI